MKEIREALEFLYGREHAAVIFERIQSLLSDYKENIPRRNKQINETDSILITYGDQIKSDGLSPLRTLSHFCEKRLAGTINGIHLLPFYPWTSDDGFSVVDYRTIDPTLGDWEDISDLGKNFRLMFDAVINHASVKSDWFTGFLMDDPRYQDFFITVEGDPDLSQVVRPRALPLLTEFDSPSGKRKIWTTFSADQADLNYKNPEVLLEVIDILLQYASHGADFIRLDAIAYLWKEIGTTCIHLPQTHRVIQLLRSVLDLAAPHVELITETNVSHKENLSYFGDGVNEAQLVYNFALPPLTLHAFRSGKAQTLSQWAASLELPSKQTTFFNFLASHDGIGINPARGILSEQEIGDLVDQVLAHGGLVSYKHNADGSQSPYELNINYFDALSNPGGTDPISLQLDRFMCAQAIMLALVGMPGIYFHSLFGSRNWTDGVEQTSRNRTINRQKLRMDEIEKELKDDSSLRKQVFSRYCALLGARRSTPAFHPHGTQQILDLHPSVFGLERISPDGATHVICLHNVSSDKVNVLTDHQAAINLLNGHTLNMTKILLEPYQILWAKL